MLAALAGRIYDDAPQQNAVPLERINSALKSHPMLPLRHLALVVPMTAAAGQSATPTVADIHDRATAIIRELANRPLTPGDTMLTWNPRPGSLIHTVAVKPGGVSSSLLRGDGMIGTATAAWVGGRLQSFEAEWTARDSVSAKPRREVHVAGEIRGDLLVVTGTKPGRYPTPSGLWFAADYGMEELAIPLYRSLPVSGTPATILVFRPWLGRWDTVTVTVRDTPAHRIVVQRTGRARETIVLTRAGALLWTWRHDQSAERRPLEGSSRYADYLAALPLLRALATKDSSSP